MASSYTSLGIEKMVTGENAGTWGDKTNANLELIAQLTGGFAQLSIAGGAQTTALTVADGALTGTAQQRFIEFTGTISGNQIVTIPNDVETFYILKNSTSGAHTVQFKYATGSGSTFTFSTTNKKVVMVQASASPDATNPNIIEINNSDISIVNDTTPQLGGNLDVNGNSIVSVSGGNISITPDGSGKVIIDGLSYPTADGSAGQFLKTDGCGNLSFDSVSSRTGAVNWCTTAKTAGFTGANGIGYFVNTAGGAITVTLPSSPSAGDIVAIKDYADNFATNNVTIARNGSKINGFCNCATLFTDGESATLVYVDATKGWQSVQNSRDDVSGAEFVSAVGGEEYICGDFRTHIFVGDANFQVLSGGNATGSNTVDYFVIAGGGGSGASGRGGGGAGGFRGSNSLSLPAPLTDPNLAPAGLPVSAQTYPITVGAGGAVGCSPGSNNAGNDGGNSVFSTITSAGGGGGGYQSTSDTARDGGSGGGGGGDPAISGPTPEGGVGNTPPVAPPQGNDGGNGSLQVQGTPVPMTQGGGGGGGAQATGSNASPSAAGAGGAGGYMDSTFFSGAGPQYGESGPISGVRYFAGGGGGAACGPRPGAYRDGGVGGGGNGSQSGQATNVQSTNGLENTGGGAGAISSGPITGLGRGGSGFVAIRYKFK